MGAHGRSASFKGSIASFVVLIAVCVSALALPVAAHATTYYVAVVGSDSNQGSTPAQAFATIQKALSVATHTGDVVSVGPGTFNGDATMTVSGVSLHGAGASLTTVRGDGHNSVIVVSGSSIGADSVISGFTITGGSAWGGGGINCVLSSPTISGNTIVGNASTGMALGGGGVECDSSSARITGNIIVNNSSIDWGGGIYCDSASPVITGNTIMSNAGGSHGGGIQCYNSSPTITGNTITGNSANYGGGLCSLGSTPTIQQNTVDGNSATNQGGGIFSSDPLATIAGNRIDGNSAPTGGGGICCVSSTATIAGNRIDGNSAGSGAGIACSVSALAIEGDEIVANTTNGTGGGIYMSNSSPSVTNSVIARNRAGGGGDGLQSTFCSPTITNDTFVGNGKGIVASAVECDPSSRATITNCILWNNAKDLVNCTATYSDVTGTGGNLAGDFSADPGFVAPDSGDYHLSAGSPCINDASPTVAPATDKDGISRPWGAGYDMGAYEYYVPTYRTTTSLTTARSVRVKKSLKVSGAVSPVGGSPYPAPGRVTITMTRKVGKRWKSAGSAKIGLAGGAFTYSFKPKYKGSWHVTATYSGGGVGPTTYLSSSSVRGVTVN